MNADKEIPRSLDYDLQEGCGWDSLSELVKESQERGFYDFDTGKFCIYPKNPRPERKFIDYDTLKGGVHPKFDTPEEA